MYSKYEYDDFHFMARALVLAKQGLFTTEPNPRVGCVIVNNGKIVGEGFHRKAGTDHAEKIAIQNAGHNAKGATAYVTLEPCCHHGKTPPCTNLIIEAGISRVVAAMEDPNPKVKGKGFEQLKEAGIEVTLGPMGSEARELNCGFVSRMERNLPFIRLKLATSLDGKTAMASGESKWITCEESREDVQRLRARSSAIITGINTVLYDNPSLSVRSPISDAKIMEDETYQPLKVILDSNARIPLDSKILNLPGKKILAVKEDISQKALRNLIDLDVTILKLSYNSSGLNIESLLKNLSKMEQNEVLFECGSSLAGSIIKQRLVDELVVYMAPNIMGNEGKDAFSLPNIDKIADRIDLQLKDFRIIGEDMKFLYTLK
tara:strand:+ start:1944 stop:3068 length:1125 start_codon:yes stop_codon:yes gene_type:complete